MTPTVDRRFLQNAFDSVTRLGIDLQGACIREGLANPLDGEGDRVPLSLVGPIYELATRESGDPAWLYRAVQTASLQGAGTLFQLLLCCSTLYDAFRLGCRYSSVATDVVTFSFHERERHVDLYVSENPDVYVSREQVEVAVYVPAQYRRLVPVAGTPLLIEVLFRHAPRFAPARYEEFFGCPVRFNATCNGLRLSRGALDTPLTGADANLQSYRQSIAERYECSALAVGTLTERVQLLFMQRMAFGEPDASDIAALLNMSRRSLQRQLLAGKTSWREATDLARQRVAERELRNPARALHEVAMLCGYGDARAFRRAFSRWTGLTPSQYRANTTR